MSSFLLNSCNFKTQNSPATELTIEEKISTANMQINKSNYTGAVATLREAKKIDPKNPKISIMLASSFAGIANILVADYWGFVVGYEPLIDGLKKNEGSLQSFGFFDFSILPSLDEASGIEFWKNIRKFLGQVDFTLAFLQKIPPVNSEQYYYLSLATKELEDVFTPGGRLYRAILNLILLRSSFDEMSKHLPLFVASTKKGSKFCGTEFSFFFNRILKCLDLLPEVMVDLTIAYPKNTNSIQETRNLLVKNKLEITNTLNLLIGATKCE